MRAGSRTMAFPPRLAPPGWRRAEKDVLARARSRDFSLVLSLMLILRALRVSTSGSAMWESSKSLRTLLNLLDPSVVPAVIIRWISSPPSFLFTIYSWPHCCPVIWPADDPTVHSAAGIRASQSTRSALTSEVLRAGSMARDHSFAQQAAPAIRASVALACLQTASRCGMRPTDSDASCVGGRRSWRVRAGSTR